MTAFVSPILLASSRPACRQTLVAATRPGLTMSASDQYSRRALLTGAGYAALAVALGQITPAVAGPAPGIEGAVAKRFFPKEGFNAPEKTTAANTKINPEVMSKPEAKQALEKLREFSDKMTALTAAFEGNPKYYNLADELQRSIKVDDIRSALNTVLEAFDEETQKTTDKLARGIIQDLSEVLYNSSIAPGVTSGRTPNRIDRITKWLAKINGDFKYLLSFYT